MKYPDHAHINMHTHVAPGGEITSAVFEWDGESDIAGFTYALASDIDPRLAAFPPVDEIAVGAAVRIGPYHLTVIDLDIKRDIIWCRRVQASEAS